MHVDRGGVTFAAMLTCPTCSTDRTAQPFGPCPGCGRYRDSVALATSPWPAVNASRTRKPQGTGVDDGTPKR